ncbi:hypothetical protein RRF57_000194 [Xylaria bambusicola]|uniref:Uncharacterized protein n=1 Tax=Xylaria bambusicola TaxID=326684 RepID=A0AAN7UE55_9PEZI
MLPAIEATSTYTSPGISCSPLSREGARDAMVDVKDFSRWNALSTAALTPSSAATACLYRNRRALPICSARRSVGVGLRGTMCCSSSTGSGRGFDDAGIVLDVGEGTGVVLLGRGVSSKSS